MLPQPYHSNRQIPYVTLDDTPSLSSSSDSDLSEASSAASLVVPQILHMPPHPQISDKDTYAENWLEANHLRESRFIQEL
ncbi:hypothetical protein E3N88_43216 [Mikania micrantha]|uniref:Uncharacterized protein n=1 Tax=Mikania micrantha TaxID=192012 RepID=A0A5N6LGE0_9ASTR|nr:hypothetical protein E3N88_43216 [Mikania micrantha]